MHNLILFTDGSVDTKTGIGFGAYLAMSDVWLSVSDLKASVKVKRFENTSSTKLELQTLLWAVEDALLVFAEEKVQMTIYNDSQNIVGLPVRRSGLEGKEYIASSGKQLNNAALYQQLFTVLDKYPCQIIKVEGHKPQRAKNDVDKIFSLVDNASRSALRAYNRDQ